MSKVTKKKLPPPTANGDLFVRVYECGCLPAGAGTETDPLRIDWCFTHLPPKRAHAILQTIRGAR